MTAEAREPFASVTIRELAGNHRGAIKIGPFGSQLRKEEMVEAGRKVYGQENVIAEDWTLGDRRVRDSKFRALSSCLLEPGDVVITMMGTIGKCLVFPETGEPGIMDSHLLRIQPDPSRVDRDFLRTVLRAEQVVGRQVARMSHGSIMSGLSSAIVQKLRVPVPPLPEQHQIATILDTIDDAIRKTEQIIAKLKQVKQGLLHDLLTRGVDDSGELRDPERHPEQFKDSPLGRIPRGWEVATLSDVAEVDRGKFTHRPRNDPAFYGGSFPFIQTGDIAAADGGMLYTASQSLNERGAGVSREFPAGTIAITIAANIADTTILGVPMYFPDSVVGAVVREPNVARFTQLCIQRAKPRLDARAPQSAQKNINLQDLRPLPIPRPSPDEQHRIAERYDALTAVLDREETSLTKHRLLKAALMEDLLTGRVRVSKLLENRAP